MPAAKKKSGSRYHHGDLRNALLEQGRLYLEESGLAEVSLRGLARRVGVSIGAPLRHFSEKDELLSVLANQGFVELSDLRRQITAKGLPLEEQIREMMRCYVRFARDNPGLFNLMTGPRVLDLGRFEELARTSELSFELFAKAAQDFAAANGWPEDSLRVVSHAAWSAEHGLAVLILTGRIPRVGHDLDIDVIVETAIDIFLRGISRPPSKDA